MINFENLDGYIIDMRTNDDCDAILEDILSNEPVLCEIMQHTPLDVKRDYITTYFTKNYKQVFIKTLNVLQVCEEELYSYGDIERLTETINEQADTIIQLNKTINNLRNTNEQGLQYAMSKDNEIEELKENIDELVDEMSAVKDNNEWYSQQLQGAHNTIDMLTTKLDKIKEMLK